MDLKHYQDRFDTIELSRTGEGVLTVRLHTSGKSHVMSRDSHRELAEVFGCIASDLGNRVVVLTGTGDHFIMAAEGSGYGLTRGLATATFLDELGWEGNRMLTQLLDIPAPVIAAVNGPAVVHGELAVLSDLVICTPDSWFSDEAHFQRGLIPGDGMGLIWLALLGLNRGRAHVLTGRRLDSEEALRLGVVWEVVDREQLLTRAYDLATDMASRNPVLLRNTRAMLTRPLKRLLADDLSVGLALEAVGSMSGAQHFAEAGRTMTASEKQNVAELR